MLPIFNVTKSPRYFWVLLSFTLVVFAQSARAADVDYPIHNLFQRMSDAFSHNNYDGVFVSAHGDMMDTMRIVHRVDHNMERERVIRLDGPRNELIRENETVTCIHPADWEGDIDHGIPVGPFAKAFARDASQLNENYEIKLLRQGEFIIERTADVLEIHPVDQLRYGYRIWVDQKTGLLLKSLMLDGANILERFQFTHLVVDGAIEDVDLEAGIEGEVIAHYALPFSPVKVIDQQISSWEPRWIPKGFEKRQVSSATNDESDTSNSHTYSDGMAAFSVFVEKRSDSSQDEAVTQMGATVAVGKAIDSAAGAHFVTVVGEVPLSTAKRVASSVAP